jgi:hypothetical protein
MAFVPEKQTPEMPPSARRELVFDEPPTPIQVRTIKKPNETLTEVSLYRFYINDFNKPNRFYAD